MHRGQEERLLIITNNVNMTVSKESLVRNQEVSALKLDRRKRWWARLQYFLRKCPFTSMFLRRLMGSPCCLLQPYIPKFLHHHENWVGLQWGLFCLMFDYWHLLSLTIHSLLWMVEYSFSSNPVPSLLGKLGRHRRYIVKIPKRWKRHINAWKNKKNQKQFQTRRIFSLRCMLLKTIHVHNMFGLL